MSTAQRPSLGVAVLVHLYSSTEIDWRVKAAEDRATVSLAGAGLADVTVFADRPELVRLRDTLDAVLVELDKQRAALDERERESAA